MISIWDRVGWPKPYDQINKNKRTKNIRPWDEKKKKKKQMTKKLSTEYSVHNRSKCYNRLHHACNNKLITELHVTIGWWMGYMWRQVNKWDRRKVILLCMPNYVWQTTFPTHIHSYNIAVNMGKKTIKDHEKDPTA